MEKDNKQLDSQDGNKQKEQSLDINNLLKVTSKLFENKELSSLLGGLDSDGTRNILKEVQKNTGLVDKGLNEKSVEWKQSAEDLQNQIDDLKKELETLKKHHLGSFY
ncbi:hypothetical protein [Thalassobacillus pellis]|uniref:hypothetical protein n=1 Tax=Thalassobacillus pellis TaxID=748008 RepID=UPI00195F34AC|nr:hypothetical protein [Thalassobacillus pellis]MBM7554304.1 FtsZ-binding cell division protein ZapB [Thalassobacillus pellis]